MRLGGGGQRMEKSSPMSHRLVSSVIISARNLYVLGYRYKFLAANYPLTCAEAGREKTLGVESAAWLIKLETSIMHNTKTLLCPIRWFGDRDLSAARHTASPESVPSEGNLLLRSASIISNSSSSVSWSPQNQNPTVPSSFLQQTSASTRKIYASP